ncbi:hypothetical protein ACLKA6_008878 [Drosophila palustris]
MRPVVLSLRERERAFVLAAFRLTAEQARQLASGWQLAPERRQELPSQASGSKESAHKCPGLAFTVPLKYNEHAMAAAQSSMVLSSELFVIHCAQWTH